MPNREGSFVVRLAVLLVAASVALCAIHYVIFRDIHTLLFYLMLDIAFLPISVLVVGVIVERLLARRERRTVRNKLNMVIGAFFSEIGNRLLTTLTPAVDRRDDLRAHLDVRGRWKKQDFDKAAAFARALDHSVDIDLLDLPDLRAQLTGHRDFMVRLLENPLLLEHTQFTDLLWAIFHLCEELDYRPSLSDLPAADRAHLAGDTRRVYGQLAAIWVEYAQHLKVAYPFLLRAGGPDASLPTAPLGDRHRRRPRVGPISPGPFPEPIERAWGQVVGPTGRYLLRPEVRQGRPSARGEEDCDEHRCRGRNRLGGRRCRLARDRTTGDDIAGDAGLTRKRGLFRLGLLVVCSRQRLPGRPRAAGRVLRHHRATYPSASSGQVQRRPHAGLVGRGGISGGNLPSAD